jgi:hypothetical protein
MSGGVQIRGRGMGRARAVLGTRPCRAGARGGAERGTIVLYYELSVMFELLRSRKPLRRPKSKTGDSRPPIPTKKSILPTPDIRTAGIQGRANHSDDKPVRISITASHQAPPVTRPSAPQSHVRADTQRRERSLRAVPEAEFPVRRGSGGGIGVQRTRCQASYYRGELSGFDSRGVHIRSFLPPRMPQERRSPPTTLGPRSSWN